MEAVDLLREPYIFEFLKIPKLAQISETQLETLLCNHLQQFLLELGKGFTFVGRQYRITLNNTHYKVDLVFYNRTMQAPSVVTCWRAKIHRFSGGYRVTDLPP